MKAGNHPGRVRLKSRTFWAALLAPLMLPGCAYAGIAAALALSGSDSGGDPPTNAAPIVTIDVPLRQTGTIDITYTLTDVNEDNADITVEHAVIPYPGTASPMPSDWVFCTEFGGDGTTNLTTTQGGDPHLYVWDAPTDLGDGVTYNAAFVRIRITPQDSSNANLMGSTQETNNFVAGNDPPTAMITTPATQQSGLIQIDYTLFDSTDDLARIQTTGASPVLLVDFSTNGGTNWATATVPVGAKTNLATSLSGVAHTFAWDSIADMGVTNSDFVRVRITPVDDFTLPGQEMPVETNDFMVQNNTPPIAFIASPIDGQVIGGDVVVQYRLFDLNFPPDLVDIDVEYSTDGGTIWSFAIECPPAVCPSPPSEGTTGLTSSDTGMDHIFVWDSVADLPGIDLPGAAGMAVQFRISPRDPAGPGTAHTTMGLRLDNNLEPGASVSTPASPQVTGSVSMTYGLLDTESDPADVDLEYSTDGGQAFTTATEIPGFPSEGTMGLSTLPGGVTHTFVWNAGMDLPGALELSVVVKITPRDHPDPALGQGPAIWTDVFIVDNTVPPTAMIDQVTTPSPGTVMLDYTLFDTESNLIDVDFSYSTNGVAGPFSPATRDPTQGDGVVGLPSLPTGVMHAFAWNTLADLGPALETNVAVRLIPSDTKTGIPVDSMVFTVDNNGAPEVEVITPMGVQSGDILIPYTAFDSNSDLVSIQVEYQYSLDGGVTYTLQAPATECTTCITPASDGISGLASAPRPTGTSHIFIWESVTDIGLITTGNVRIRITPSDSATGLAISTLDFALDNGSLVPIVLIDFIPRSYPSNVMVSYRILDGNSSPADVAVQYSTDGTNFSPVTTIVSTDEGTISGNVISGQSTSSSGVIHDLVWDSATDLGAGAVTGVQVRLIPSDVDGPGLQDTSDPFIRGNDAPGVTITSPTGAMPESGLIRFAVDIIDSTSDPVDLTVLYDAGAGFQPATISVGSVSALPSAPAGASHSFAWNSIADLGVQNLMGVVVQVTPTDDEPLAGPLDSVTLDVPNNDLPVAFIGTPTMGDVRSSSVNVTHILIDGNSDTITLTVEYRTSAAGVFMPATLANTDQGTISGNQISGLSSSPGGNNHSFDWLSDADFLAQDTDEAQVRITPDDPQNTGNPFTSGLFLVNNNFEPSVTISYPVGSIIVEGTVLVDYTLLDTEQDLVDIDVEYSLDGGTSWGFATPDLSESLHEGTTGLSTVPAMNNHIFAWDSAADAAGINTEVAIRIIPSDHPVPRLGQGPAGQTGVFTTDNTMAPQVNTLTNSSLAGIIALDYFLFDAELPTGATVDITVEHSFDSGISFFPSTITFADEGLLLGNLVQGQTPSNIGSGQPHSIRWDSEVDVGFTNITGVIVRLTPKDTKQGLPTDLTFDVLNNSSPVVIITDISGIQSGIVNINYALRDPFSDTLDIVVEYIAGGAPPAPATLISTDQGTIVPPNTVMGLSSGPLGLEVSHQIIWDSLADLSTTVINDVAITITATDPFGAMGLVTSNTFIVDNAIDADLVLGKDTFAQAAVDGRGLSNQLFGVHFDGTNLFIADSRHHRVLILNAIPTSNFQTADVVLGQPSFTTSQSNFGGVTASSLAFPEGIYSDGTRLYVPERGNSRVLIWDTIPTANFAPADHVLGQPNLTSRGQDRGGSAGADTLDVPRAVFGDSTHLYVSDGFNHRILVWNLPIDFSLGEGPPADFVLGQADFTSETANRGATVAADTLNSPYGVFTDGTTLFCADFSNNRVLQWDLPITVNGEPADRVLGQPDMTTNTINTGGRSLATMHQPQSVSADSTSTYVADKINNRVLIWLSTAPVSSSPADIVLGHADGTSGASNDGGLSATSLSGPATVYSTDTKLLIADSSNARIKIHDPIPASNNAPAQVVFGQKDFTSGLPNHGEVNARFMGLPAGVETDGNALFVADHDNNRVLGWRSLPGVNNKNADLVFGQSSFTSSSPGTGASRLSRPADVAYDPNANGGAGRLFVADTTNNRVVVYDGPFVVGQAGSEYIGQMNPTDATSGTTQSKFWDPRAVSWDGTFLWVADRRNNRVVRFTPPFFTGMNADLLLGQALYTDSGFNHSGADPLPVDGDQSLNSPESLVSTGSELLVGCKFNHRVLVWTPLPTMDDEAASVAIGQPDLTTMGGGGGRGGLRFPLGVDSDGVGVYVSDASNNRILIWNSMPAASGVDADRIIGQPDFTSMDPNNGGISARSLFVGTNLSAAERTTSPAVMTSGGSTILWVPDQQNDRVLRFDVTP
ncbi:MAG: NHL repeat-containing protein [Planctomycetota bacterium]|nr:NHL repeat-containing protein [Planctomycetota bacterium]